MSSSDFYIQTFPFVLLKCSTSSVANQHIKNTPSASSSPPLISPASCLHLLFLFPLPDDQMSSVQTAAFPSPCCLSSAHRQFSHKADWIHSFPPQPASFTSLFLLRERNEAKSSHRYTHLHASKWTLTNETRKVEKTCEDPEEMLVLNKM